MHLFFSVDENREEHLGHSGMLGLFIGISVLTCLGLWVYHAYRNPHTRLGQILIKVSKHYILLYVLKKKNELLKIFYQAKIQEAFLKLYILLNI